MRTLSVLILNTSLLCAFGCGASASDAARPESGEPTSVSAAHSSLADANSHLEDPQEAPSTPAVATDPVSDAAPPPAPEPTAAPDAVAAVPLAAPAPAWRVCQSDDDCLLKASVCAPLEPNGTRFCREPLAPAGGSCSGIDDCELGLFCAWAGVEHSAARVCVTSCPAPTFDSDGLERTSGDPGCSTQGRRALACGGDGPAPVIYWTPDHANDPPPACIPFSGPCWYTPTGTIDARCETL